MMGTADPQPSMFYHINLEQYVTADHPMRKIRPLIDTARIRQLCEPLYAETGRPSIPPEQLFLALLVCGAGFGSDAVGSLHVLTEPEAAVYGERAARTVV